MVKGMCQEWGNQVSFLSSLPFVIHLNFVQFVCFGLSCLHFGLGYLHVVCPFANYALCKVAAIGLSLPTQPCQTILLIVGKNFLSNNM